MSADLESKPETAEGAEVRRRPSGFAQNELTEKIISAAIEVHRHLGPGLLESAYEECLCYELSRMGLRFERQRQLPIVYKGLRLDCGYRLDLVVEDEVIAELKATDELLPIHSAQLLNYLKASGKRIGLLINFNVPILKKGLKRVVNRYTGPLPSARVSASSAFETADRHEIDFGPVSDSSPRQSPRLRVSAVKEAC
jgi:GxxExxY protein